MIPFASHSASNALPAAFPATVFVATEANCSKRREERDSSVDGEEGDGRCCGARGSGAREPVVDSVEGVDRAASDGG